MPTADFWPSTSPPGRRGDTPAFAEVVALRVPINHPAWSSGMSVLVKGSAESVSSADLQVSEPGLFGDGCG